MTTKTFTGDEAFFSTLKSSMTNNAFNTLINAINASETLNARVVDAESTGVQFILATADQAKDMGNTFASAQVTENDATGELIKPVTVLLNPNLISQDMNNESIYLDASYLGHELEHATTQAQDFIDALNAVKDSNSGISAIDRASTYIDTLLNHEEGAFDTNISILRQIEVAQSNGILGSNVNIDNLIGSSGVLTEISSGKGISGDYATSLLYTELYAVDAATKVGLDPASVMGPALQQWAQNAQYSEVTLTTYDDGFTVGITPHDGSNVPASSSFSNNGSGMSTQPAGTELSKSIINIDSDGVVSATLSGQINSAYYEDAEINVEAGSQVIITGSGNSISIVNGDMSTSGGTNITINTGTGTEVIAQQQDGSGTITLNGGTSLSYTKNDQVSITSEGQLQIASANASGGSLVSTYDSTDGNFVLRNESSISTDSLGVITNDTKNYDQEGKLDTEIAIVTEEDKSQITTTSLYNEGVKTSDSWVRSDGATGINTYNADGSSTGVTDSPDGTHFEYTDDGQGNITRTDYDEDGVKIGDSWVHADGSVGTDTFKEDGSSSGITMNVDGTSKDYVDDGQGNVTTTGYTSEGNEQYAEVAKTTASGTNVTISGDGDNTSFDNANITITNGSSATVTGDNNKVVVGEDATADLKGNKETVTLNDGATADASGSYITENGRGTVVGSNDQVDIEAQDGAVSGDHNTVWSNYDGGRYSIVGNENNFSGEDNETVIVTGDNNIITTGEISTDQVVGQDNTLQLWGGGSVTIAASSSADIENAYQVIVASSSLDEEGDEVTTYWNVPTINGDHDYESSGGTLIGQSVEDSDTGVITTDMYFSTGGVREHEVVTSLDDGNQVDDITEYNLNGNRVSQLMLTTDEDDNITSEERISYTNNQVSSDDKTSYLNGTTTITTSFDSAGNLESTTIYESNNGDGHPSITYLDEDGAITEEENYLYNSAGDFVDERNYFNSDGQQTKQYLLNYLGDVTQSTQFEDGIKTETDIFNPWGNLGEVDHFNDLGQETQKDLYFGDTVAESDTFNADGQQIEKDIFNSDGQLTQQDQYDDQGNITSSWTSGDDGGSGDSGGGDPTGGDDGDPSGGDDPIGGDDGGPFSGGGDEGGGDEGGGDDGGGFIDFGFVGDKIKVDKIVNGNTNVIAQYDASHGDAAGAAAAEAAMQRAQQMAALSSTPGPHAAVLEGGQWGTNTITWSLTNDTSIAGLPITGEMNASYEQTVEDAFATWAKASGLTFKEVSDSAQSDIRIGFSDLDTADSAVIGYTTSSNQDGAFTPGTVIRLEDPNDTPLTADADGQQSYAGTDATLNQVLLHEIGHALGLAEDADSQSIMFYDLTADNRTLNATDIAGIQSLYDHPFSSHAASADQLIQAMASFTPQSAAQTNTVAANDPAINPLLLAAVH